MSLIAASLVVCVAGCSGGSSGGGFVANTGNQVDPNVVASFDVSANPPTLATNQTTTLTVTAINGNGDPIANFTPDAAGIAVTTNAGTPATVTYSGITDNGDGTATIPSSAVFDAIGQLDFDVTNTAAETVTITLTASNGATGSVMVTWIDPNVLTAFMVTASPTSAQVVTNPFTITATALNGLGLAIPNFVDAANPITVMASSINVTYTGITDNGNGMGAIPANTAFDASGQFTFMANNTMADANVSIVLTANNGSMGSVSVTWINPGAGDLFSFMLTASPTNPIQGNATTITVTALNFFGMPISGFSINTDISLTSSSANVTYQSVSLTTADDGGGTGRILANSTFDVNGQFVFMATNNVAEGPVTITASVTGPLGQASGSVMVTWIVDPNNNGVNVSGTVFVDVDMDGTLDGNELGIANVQVDLRDSVGALSASVLTDSTGLFTFTNVADGDYTVQVPTMSMTGVNADLFSAFDPTMPNPPTRMITVNGVNVMGQNFGFALDLANNDLRDDFNCQDPDGDGFSYMTNTLTLATWKSELQAAANNMDGAIFTQIQIQGFVDQINGNTGTPYLLSNPFLFDGTDVQQAVVDAFNFISDASQTADARLARSLLAAELNKFAGLGLMGSLVAIEDALFATAESAIAGGLDPSSQQNEFNRIKQAVDSYNNNGTCVP